MILDKLLQLSASQVVTADARSTDVIDLKQNRDLHIGEPMYLVCNIEAVSGTSPTLTINLETDDNAAFSSTAIIASSPALAPPVAGTRVVIPMPIANERYLSAFYDVGGTTPSVTITSHLTATPPPGWQAYPGAIPS